MATNSRDVKLTLSLETLGEENVHKLRAAIRGLADDGSDAAPEFEKLVTAIDALGAQSAALGEFRALTEQTERLSAEQAEAAQRADHLGARLAELRTTTAGFAASQQQARDALQAAQTEVVQVAGDMLKLRSEYDAAGKKTDQYRVALAGLVDRQVAARTAVLDARAALADANKEYGTAERSLKSVETAYTRANDSAQQTAQAFAASAEALHAAQVAAETLGVSTTDVAGAQARLTQAFGQLGTEAQELQHTLEAGAQALRDQEAAAQQAEAQQRELLQSLNAEIRLRQQLSSEREQAAAASRAAAAAAQAEEEALQEAAAAARARIAASEQMAEEDRLLMVQQQAMNDLLRRGADALHAETAAIREAGQASNLYEAQKRQQAEAERLAADAAEQAAQRIENSFRVVGVRSAQELEREIDEVRAAMVAVQAQATATGSRLSGALAAGEERVKGLQRELRELNGTLTIGDRLSRTFSGALGQITAGNLIADGIGFLVSKVKELGTEFFTTNLQIQRVTKALNQVYGDTRLAADQLAFLRETAKSSGVSVGEMADAFVKFSAATRSSGIELGTVNAVFAATVRAAGTLGLTADQVGGTLEALGQMASKGTVSMEELRQQLGDRLPGALSIAARGLGVTEERLTAMVETGNLTARQFFPAFEKGLRETFGSGTQQVEGFIQAWNRLKNAVAEAAQQASNTSLFTSLGKVFDALASNINGVVTALGALTQAFIVAKAINLATTFLGIGQAATTAASAIATKTAATVANTTAAASAAIANTRLAAAFGAVGTAARSATALVGGLPGVLALVLLNARELGTWIGESVAKYTAAGDAMRKYEEAMRKQAEAERAAAEQKRALQAEQDNLNLKNTEAAAKATSAAAAAVAASKEAVKAKEAEIAISTQYADIVGSEQATLRAAASAAQDRLTVTVKQSVASAGYVVAIQEQIAAIEKTTDANGRLTEKQTEQVTKLRELLAVKKEEAAGDASKVQSLELERIQRQLASDMYADNAGRVDQLAQAYENARAKAQALIGSGASIQTITKANAEAAAAARLLANGYLDAATNIKAKATAEQSSIGITLAKADAERSAYERMADTARASGDVATATYYEVEARQKAIKTIELSAQAKRIEAQATIDAAQKELDGLRVTGLLTKEKEREIDLRISNARAKQEESKASYDQIRALQDEIARILQGGDARRSSARATDEQSEAMDRLMMKYTMSAAYSERQIALLEKEAAAQEKLIELENKRLNRDKEGFSLNTGGQRVVQQVENRASVYNTAKNAGLTEQQALEISNRFIDAYGNLAGYAGADPRKGENWQTELLKAINQMVLQNAQQAAQSSGSSVTGTYTAAKSAVAPAPAPAVPAANTETAEQLTQRAVDAMTRGDEATAKTLQLQIVEMQRAALQAANKAANKTVTVNINMNGASSGSIRTDEAGAALLEKLLADMSRSA